jgi:hypothetical protein
VGVTRATGGTFHLHKRRAIPLTFTKGHTKMPKGNSVVPANERPFEKLVAYLRDRAVVDQTEFDPEEINAEQVDKIMTATSEDDLWEAMKMAGLTGLKDLENGQALRIHGYRLLQGDLGIGVYAVLDADDPDTGEAFALDTGVTRILAFLRMCEVMEKFPVEVIVSKKATASGNELITLKKRATRAVKSTTVE